MTLVAPLFLPVQRGLGFLPALENKTLLRLPLAPPLPAVLLRARCLLPRPVLELARLFLRSPVVLRTRAWTAGTGYAVPGLLAPSLPIATLVCYLGGLTRDGCRHCCFAPGAAVAAVSVLRSGSLSLHLCLSAGLRVAGLFLLARLLNRVAATTAELCGCAADAAERSPSLSCGVGCLYTCHRLDGFPVLHLSRVPGGLVSVLPRSMSRRR
jgi:hypothetical protein